MFKYFLNRSTWELLLRRRNNCLPLSRVEKSCQQQYVSKQDSTCFTFRLFRRSYASQKPKTGKLPFEVETNVTKGVLVFSYNNDRFYKLLSYFGAAQFLFWGYLASFSYSHLRDISREDEEKRLGINLSGEDGDTAVVWWRRINLGQNKYRNGIALLCFSVGYIVLFISMVYPLRAVKTLGLMKGGQSVGITTFAPFGSTRSFVVPLQNINCILTRTQAQSQIPLKIKGRWFFFLLDKKGVFHNPEFFDYSIGLHRDLKK